MDRVITGGEHHNIERTEALLRVEVTPSFHRKLTLSRRSTTRPADMTRSSETFSTKAFMWLAPDFKKRWTVKLTTTTWYRLDQGSRATVADLTLATGLRCV